jgi:hypothetical protein
VRDADEVAFAQTFTNPAPSNDIFTLIKEMINTITTAMFTVIVATGAGGIQASTYVILAGLLSAGSPLVPTNDAEYGSFLTTGLLMYFVLCSVLLMSEK